MRDYDAMANRMLEPWRDRPAERARRISGLYAAFFVEDPLLHTWFGLASFVSRNIAWALEHDTPFGKLFADGNLELYQAFMPSLLRFRDGLDVPGVLGPGFAALREAGELARTDLDGAFAATAHALEAHTIVEQTAIVRELFDQMPAWQGPLLRPFFFFRLGWDSAAEVIRFDGFDPSDAAQRVTWLRAEILPKWEAARRTRLEWLRADCDRNRRDARLRYSALPERKAPPPGVRGTWSSEVGRVESRPRRA